MRGLERGIERAIGRLTVAAYVEIEAFIIFNLVRQMEQGMVDAAPIWANLKTFPSGQFHGKIHGIVGGYPCQPFSTAGKQEGENDPRHLWPYIRKAIASISPVWCFFENVANHLNIGFEQVYTELSAMGYSVEAGVYSAEEVGASHQRKRLFILAVANSYVNGPRSKNHLSKLRRKSIGTSKELGNTESDIKRNDRNKCGKSKRKVGRSDSNVVKANNLKGRLSECEQGQEWSKQGNSPETNGSGEAVAHAVSSGQSKLGNYEQQITSRVIRACYAGATEFPAGQGDYQHEWEEPRTVEPGVGCTIDGYNFKEDLLRMYGNGVVEQSAELAFIYLMRKHFYDQ